MKNNPSARLPYTLPSSKPNSNHNMLAKSPRSTIALVAKQAIPEILFITSYPDRECGIATYSQDLIHAIKDKFGSSFSLKVCALENKERKHKYPKEVKYVLTTSSENAYYKTAHKINNDDKVQLVFIQHEFGLFSGEYGEDLLQLLSLVKKPTMVAFHTVLPNPDEKRKSVVQAIASFAKDIVVMTETSARILQKEYNIPAKKITVIHHGTHLVRSLATAEKNEKFDFGDRYVFSTFGLLNSGKGIETALDALPAIVAKFPNVLYLIIGKTHPTVFKNEGEKYRESLQEKVVQLGLQGHVKFINKYLSLPELLAYLQRTDIYFFTSKDPFQAVSGTFAYAMASGCPVISTPIPHTIEMLQDNAGIIVDFQNPSQLADATLKLLYDPILMESMSLNALHKIAPTAWENSAISHVELMSRQFKKHPVPLQFTLPKMTLAHIRRLTTDKGMIQFSKISVPDPDSGYTLDDNARALMALVKHYKLTNDRKDLNLIKTYLDFIIFCLQEDNSFLNYVDFKGNFLVKSDAVNLEDANGRAIWALGEFSAHERLFDYESVKRAEGAIERVLPNIPNFTSPRAIAFAIKGLYHYNTKKNDIAIKNLIIQLADDLVSKYNGVSDADWNWFEDSLTYANSVLPEAMLYAYLASGNETFKNIALSSFDFLLKITFRDEQIKVVSNQGWHNRGKAPSNFGEQPIDVAYTILALELFYDTFDDNSYLEKMNTAFNWFLGKNHLHQIIYNPCTGGCYDGLEEKHVNLNQGAESAISYLLARLTMEKYNKKKTAYALIEGNKKQLYA